MTKETMYDVKISANDLARLVSMQPIVMPAALLQLQYHVRPNGGFWVLSDEACKGARIEAKTPEERVTIENRNGSLSVCVDGNVKIKLTEYVARIYRLGLIEELAKETK
jgi:hypothetical protein